MILSEYNRMHTQFHLHFLVMLLFMQKHRQPAQNEYLYWQKVTYLFFTLPPLPSISHLT